jgi:hypothetical protein
LFIPDYLVNQIKPDEVERGCTAQGWRIHDCLENLKKNYRLLDRRVDGKIILNWIYKEHDPQLWLGMG